MPPATHAPTAAHRLRAASSSCRISGSTPVARDDLTNASPLGEMVRCSAGQGGWAVGRDCSNWAAAKTAPGPLMAGHSKPHMRLRRSSGLPPLLTLGEVLLLPLGHQGGVAQVVGHHDGRVQAGKVQGGHRLVVVPRLRVETRERVVPLRCRYGGGCSHIHAFRHACMFGQQPPPGTVSSRLSPPCAPTLGSSTVAPSYATPSLGSPPRCRPGGLGSGAVNAVTAGNGPAWYAWCQQADRAAAFPATSSTHCPHQYAAPHLQGAPSSPSCWAPPGSWCATYARSGRTP